MIDLKDLWIGDYLEIVSSGKQGTFEGIAENGQAIIKTSTVFIKAESKDLLLIKEPPLDLESSLDNPEEEVDNIWENFSSIIDLHLDALLEDKEDFQPRDPIKYQIEKCSAFIEKAIEKKLGRVIIIHGKGDGTLKNEVLSLLKKYPETGLTLDIHDGGATEVHLKPGKF